MIFTYVQRLSSQALLYAEHIEKIDIFLSSIPYHFSLFISGTTQPYVVLHRSGSHERDRERRKTSRGRAEAVGGESRIGVPKSR